MQLTYRGIQYSHNQKDLQIAKTEQTGMFRGARYQIKTAVSAAPRRSEETLSYRLVKYVV